MSAKSHQTPPLVVETVAGLRDALATRSSERGTRVGFVPTMGYLHEGHAALMRRMREECEVAVASIFVNPTQFGADEDFTTYPRDLERDVALLTRERVDIAFVPAAGGLYPDGAGTVVQVGAVAEPLEGERRPGHFRGVATVVAMLLNAVQPARAYFGEKDWQQLQVVRAMVRDLLIPVEIVGVPIVREPDGLAMSSRNVRLSHDARRDALVVPRSLDAARAAFARGERDPMALERAMHDCIAPVSAATLDYAVVVNAETLRPVNFATAESRALVAAKVGGVRLIDNVALG